LPELSFSFGGFAGLEDFLFGFDALEDFVLVLLLLDDADFSFELFDVLGLFELVFASALAALPVRALGGRSVCSALLDGWFSFPPAERAATTPAP
jgi:hypothetical protein